MPEYVQFAEKIKGLVMQFCSVASPRLALDILRSCASASISTMGEIKAPLFVELAEETLKNYFTHAEDENPLQEAASHLRFDVTAVELITRVCLALLISLVLLYRPLFVSYWCAGVCSWRWAVRIVMTEAKPTDEVSVSFIKLWSRPLTSARNAANREVRLHCWSRWSNAKQS